MGTKKDRREINSKGSMALAQAISYVEEFLANLRRGVLVIQDGDENLQLRPAPTIAMEVEAKQKDSKESFGLKLSWRKENSKPAAEEAEREPSRA